VRNVCRFVLVESVDEVLAESLSAYVAPPHATAAAPSVH